MNKLLITCVSVFLLILLIGTVCAEEVTIKVDTKRVEGMGSDVNPLGEYVNPMYVISEREHISSANYITQEYPILLEDYCKINVGDTVTLKVPTDELRPFEVLKIQ